MGTNNPPAIGKRSPWGTIDFVHPLADGVWRVATPGHGGIKLDRKRNAAVPAEARRSGGWYEEDAEWAIAALVHPDAFPSAEAEAARVCKDWNPDEYTAITGEPVTAVESYVVAQREFVVATQHQWVAVSAIHHGGDRTLVAVTATLGGRSAWTPESEVRTYLVAADRYAGRSEHGYVINEERDTLVSSEVRA